MQRVTNDTIRFLQQEIDLSIVRRDSHRFMEVVELMSNLDREYTLELLSARFKERSAVNTLIDFALSKSSIA